MSDETKTKMIEAVSKLSASTICLFLLGGHLYLNHQSQVSHNDQVREIMEQSNRIEQKFVDELAHNGEYMELILKEAVSK